MEDKKKNNSKKPQPHHRIHLWIVAFFYVSSFAISYLVLTYEEITISFISILSAGAIFATFGSALTSIGALIERDLLERIKLNIDILYKDIYEMENPWRRWPFLPRNGRKKLFNDIEHVAELSNPELPLDVGTHIINVDLPTVLEDFFDLPLIKNTKNLIRFHRAAHTARIRKPKDKKNKDTGLKPSDEYMAYECMKDIWVSVLKFRFSRYVIHFGAGLIISSVVVVSYSFVCKVA